MRFETSVLIREAGFGKPFWFEAEHIGKIDCACISMIEAEFATEGHDQIIIVFSTVRVNGAAKQTEILEFAGYEAIKRLPSMDQMAAQLANEEMELYWWVEFPEERAA